LRKSNDGQKLEQVRNCVSGLLFFALYFNHFIITFLVNACFKPMFLRWKEILS